MHRLVIVSSNHSATIQTTTCFHWHATLQKKKQDAWFHCMKRILQNKQIITNRLDMTYLSNGAGVTIWTIYGKDKTQLIVDVCHHDV